MDFYYNLELSNILGEYQEQGTACWGLHFFCLLRI